MSCFHIHADDAADRRRKRAERAALGLLLFSPWKKLRPQIAIASHDVGNYFDAVDLALATGGVSEALQSGISIVPSLSKLIRASILGGYEDGGNLVGKRASRGMIAQAEALAAARAQTASGLIYRTSQKWLRANPDNEFALSEARAEIAARFEAAQAYYNGLQMVLYGYGMMKSWLTTSDNPCDDCLENEDEGPIAMEATFPSGDDAPLLHVRCECVLSVEPLAG